MRLTPSFSGGQAMLTLDGDTFAFGIDPGETTGLVIARLHADNTYDVLAAEEIAWDDRFRLIPLLRDYQPSTIVMEAFILYPHKASDQIGQMFPSVRVIGLVEAACNFLELSQPHFQMAAVRTRVKVLPQHELKLRSTHTRDAYKHLRFYLVKSQHAHA
jgi:hypothetical protein